MRRAEDHQRKHGPRLFSYALLVALGAMLGTAARAVLEGSFGAEPGTWPWTTFWINMLGSLVLGFLLESLAVLGDDVGPRRAVRLGIGTGVIGGFTTYSTFVLEIDRIGRIGALPLATAYAFASVVLGVFASMVGLALADKIVIRRRAKGSELA